MKALVFGYGSMGRRHAINAQVLGHEVFVREGRCDRMTLARNEGFSAGDFPPQGKDGPSPDAVIIATPAHGHQALLKRYPSLPTFVEKPLGLTLFDSPVDRHALLHVGYNWRFDSAVQLARKRTLEHGAVAARFVVSVNGDSWPGAEYADALLECSHEIDLALHLLGTAICVGASSAADGRVWQLLLEHASGACSQVHIDTLRKGYERHFDILHPSGRFTDIGLSPKDVEHTYLAEMRAFLDAAGTPSHSSPIACTLNEARAVLAICDTARLLSNKGRPYPAKPAVSAPKSGDK